MAIQIPQGFGQVDVAPGLNTMAQAYQQNTQTLGPALMQRQTQMALANAQLEETKRLHEANILQAQNTLQATKEWHDMMDAQATAQKDILRQQVAQQGSIGTYKAVEDPTAQKALTNQIQQNRLAAIDTKYPGTHGIQGIAHPIQYWQATHTPVTSQQLMTQGINNFQQIPGALPQTGGQLPPGAMGGGLTQPGLNPLQQQQADMQIKQMMMQMGPAGQSVVQNAQRMGIQDHQTILAMMQNAQQILAQQAPQQVAPQQ